MSDLASETGIVNQNGREPSVASKLETHRRIVALNPFRTSHRIVLGDARSMNSVKDESVHLVVGFAAVNYSERWTGMEGTRSFPVERKPQRALQESDETSRRLLQIARPAFDEFLLLKFRATNQQPFPFSWLNPSGIAADYGAALVRIADLYEKRFLRVRQAIPKAAEHRTTFPEEPT